MRKNYWGATGGTLLTLFLLIESTHGQNCYTNGGPNPGKPCVFPFTHEGKTYNGCPPDPEAPGKTWCSTKTDYAGNHVTSQGEYGFCSAGCPSHREGSGAGRAGSKCKTIGGPKPNVDCVFPFIFEGVTYNACPIDLVEPTKRWCSTKVDARGVHVTGQGEFGHCGPECPIDAAPALSTTQCSGGETCRPFVLCSAQVSPRAALDKLCGLPDGTNGICCAEVTKLREVGGMLTGVSIRQFGITADFSQISNAAVLRSVDLGESFLQNVTQARSKTRTLRPGSTSAESQHAMFQLASPGVIQRGRACLVAMETARGLIRELGFTDTRQAVTEINFENADIRSSFLEQQCPANPVCNFNSKYRTIDGSCNNQKNPKFGLVFTPLQRVLPNAYADRLVLPRVSNSGRPLPSPRLVTNIAIASRVEEEKTFTAMLVAFGQFLDHDLDHVPISRNEAGDALECCTEDGQIPATNPDPTLCFPIEIPKNDAIFRGSRRCINFARSVCSLRLDCQPGPIEQVNQVTHWLDTSNVYGSTNEVARSVRAFKDGLLKTVPCDNGNECLPFANNSNCLGPSRRCALAGDLRVNEQPTLGVMHLLFVREHNRIARELGRSNRQWNDERIYQESRRIVNAQWQHIIYNEFLPVLLGNEFLENFQLNPLTSGFSNVYRDDFDPRVVNAFAAAAFRIGHTLITEVIKLFKNREIAKILNLREVFNNGDLLRQGDTFDQILAGLTIQPSETYDTNFADDVVNHLFDDGELGMDLIAINMQRGRDHGLPGYIFYREICADVAEPRVTRFDQLSSNMSPQSIKLLQQAYEHVEDIDLFMGMTHERPCRDGALVGCTFLCLIGDTFARARLGDRFFYDLPNQAGSFTIQQLNQIRRTSLARLICDNSKTDIVTPQAFRQPDPRTNPPTRCQSGLLLSGIPRVDLSVFKE